MWIFKKYILVCNLYSVHLPDLFRPYVNFMASRKVGILSKKLHTKKYF